MHGEGTRDASSDASAAFITERALEDEGEKKGASEYTDEASYGDVMHMADFLRWLACRVDVGDASCNYGLTDATTSTI